MSVRIQASTNAKSQNTALTCWGILLVHVPRVTMGMVEKVEKAVLRIG